MQRHEEFSRRVRLIVKLTKGPRVLNVGASGNTKPEGRNQRHFVQAALVGAGYSVVGADVNQAGVDWLNRQGFEALHMDAQAIPADGEQFDSIVAGELIEHLENPGEFLSGCARRLKQDGRLLLSTPQPWSPVHFVHYLASPAIANTEHTCYFDRQTLGQLLGRHGFLIEQAYFVNDVRPEGGNVKLRILGAVGVALSWAFPARFRTTLVVSARQAGEHIAPVSRETWDE